VARPLLARLGRGAARSLAAAALGALALRRYPKQRIFAAWRRAADLAAQERKQRRQGLQTEALAEIMFRRFRRGRAAGFAALVLAEWQRGLAKRRAHATVELAVCQWDRGRRAGLLAAALREWRRRSGRRRAQAAVELMMRQWRRGNEKGLRASAFTDWRRVKDEAAGREAARAAVLVFAEGNRRQAAIHACLLCWRHVVSIQHLCRAELARRCQERSSLNTWLAALAISLWKFHLQELKAEESLSMVVQLQQERSTLEESLASAYEQVDQVMATMQREMRNKELLAADLREVTLQAKLDLISESGEAGSNGLRSLDHVSVDGASTPSSATALQTPARPGRALTARPSPISAGGSSGASSPWTAKVTRPWGSHGTKCSSLQRHEEEDADDLPMEQHSLQASLAASRSSSTGACSAREERQRRRQISPLALTVAEMRSQPPLLSPGRLTAAPGEEASSSAPALRRVGSWKGTAPRSRGSEHSDGVDTPQCDWPAVEERLRGEMRGRAECSWDSFKESLEDRHLGGPALSARSGRSSWSPLSSSRPCGWGTVASRLQQEGLLRSSEGVGLL